MIPLFARIWDFLAPAPRVTPRAGHLDVVRAELAALERELALLRETDPAAAAPPPPKETR